MAEVNSEEQKQLDKIKELMDKSPFKLAVVKYSEIDFLEKNARFMANETYRNLVDNVKADGALTSVPFCWKQKNGRYLVLSGNHRIKASHDAGIDDILILFTDKDMSKDERIARQLSHNSLVGQDDLLILKELWTEIDNVKLKYYAGLDDKTMKALTQITLPTLSEVNLDYRTASIVFLPHEKEHLEKVIEEAFKIVGSKDVYLANYADFDRYLDSLGKTQSSYNVKNAATALMLVLNCFEEHQDELADGWFDGEDATHQSWVPLASIFGTDKVPADVAAVVKRAVDRMVKHKEIGKKTLWHMLDLLAGDYLSGADDEEAA